MFEKYLLRRFTHPLYPTLLYLVTGAALSWMTLRTHPLRWELVLVFLAGGVMAWTFIEYLLHRFVFHLTEISEPWKTLASGLHMAHHDAPEIPELIVAPPLVSISFALLLFFLFWAISQSPAIAALLLSGLLIGYCFYEWVHFADHVYPMRSKLTRYWKKYHLQHHHKHPHRGYGVTSSLWDHVFRTFPTP